MRGDIYGQRTVTEREEEGQAQCVRHKRLRRDRWRRGGGGLCKLSNWFSPYGRRRFVLSAEGMCQLPVGRQSLCHLDSRQSVLQLVSQKVTQIGE